MKKTLLLLAAFAAATFSFAQTKGTHGETIDAHGIITAAPADATVKEFTRTGMSVFYNDEDGLAYKVDQSGTIKVAFCADGSVFFQDIVSRAAFGTWVVGTLSGNDITIKTHQPVYYDPVYNATVSIIRYSVEMGIENLPDDIHFTYRTEDSGREVLALQDCPDYNNTVGTVWDDDDQIQELGDFATELVYDENYVPSEFDTEVIIPDGVKMETYNCYAYTYLNDRYINYEIQLGYSGNDLYISGLYTAEPTFTVKGHREGNIVTFPQYQYLGIDGRAVAIYAVAVAYGVDEDGVEVFVDSKDGWSLSYDPATGDYNGELSVVRFARNPYYAYGNSYDSIDEIVISPMPEGIGVLAPATHDSLPMTRYDLQGRRLNNSAKGIYLQGSAKHLAR